MIKSLSIPESTLPLPQRLLYICKKPYSNGSNESKPEIDFLTLEKELEILQTLHEKSLHQTIEFVDENLEKFTKITENFNKIETNVKETEQIVKNLIPKINLFKEKVFVEESRIRGTVEKWEIKKMKDVLTLLAKENAEKVVEFVEEFEEIASKNVENLTTRQKFFIVRFLKERQLFKEILAHPGGVGVVGESVNVVIDNIGEEIEFYMSEQLSRVCMQMGAQEKEIDGKNEKNNEEIQDKKTNFKEILNELKIWYSFTDSPNTFYEIVEENISSRELSALESYIVSYKQELLLGKNLEIVDDFFSKFTRIINGFPDEYPKKQILSLVQKFLLKKELSFLYSYISPIFPEAYNSYQKHIKKLSTSGKTELHELLKSHHNWNLKFWAELRSKSILDRSARDLSTVGKWVEIILKKNCMIPGTKPQMLKILFALINRYCEWLSQQGDEEGAEQREGVEAERLGKVFGEILEVFEALGNKLREGFEEELNGDQMQIEIVEKSLEKVELEIKNILNKAFEEFIIKNMTMILTTCKSSLIPYKTLISSIIAKKAQKPQNFNEKETLLCPLLSYFKNSPSLPEKCIEKVTEIILKNLQKYYDNEYVKEVYNYCEKNVSKEQMKIVMEVVAQERNVIFDL